MQNVNCEPADSEALSGASLAPTPDRPRFERRPSRASRLGAWKVLLYRRCDAASEVLLYLMVVFSPWAFGSTQTWAIWVMNFGGYALGVLLAIKVSIRRWTGYRRWRCDEGAAPGVDAHDPKRRNTQPRRAGFLTGRLEGRTITTGLACLTAALLLYILVSCLNARATFLESTLTFEYRECIQWLPHSLDSAATWQAFWKYLALACVFWSLRDWLLGRTSEEERAQWRRPAAAPVFPGRLRRLVWLLAINGALLGLECVIQRLADSPRLLFLVKPRIHQSALLQFGPYAYRSNAAQYFNLVWPVCLGLWCALNQHPRRGSWKHDMLLVCGAVMAACPVISTSRGGAMIALGMSALVVGFLLAGHFLSGARGKRVGWKVGAFFVAALVLGLGFGARALWARLTSGKADLQIRRQLYETGRQMARDYPWFGTGAGAYETVSQLYPRPDVFWPAQLHNDWLETRITFGWTGSAILGLAMLLVFLRWFAGGGIRAGGSLVGMIWLALAGCLVHARFDFPLQIHSVMFLVVVLAAVLSAVGRPSHAGDDVSNLA